MTDRLRFGTAGLRGPLGDGPLAMNDETVGLAVDAIARWLPPGNRVVIGHDARHGSEGFARLAASILTEAGHTVAAFDRPVPTPLVPFAMRGHDFGCGIVVTASHNPATDNGMKVYAPDGAQLGAADASEIEEWMDRLDRPEPGADRLPDVTMLGEETIEAYMDAVRALAAPAEVPQRIVTTAMHGVGADIVDALLRSLGHEVHPVPEQRAPDPDFPTAAFPNPEEDGALDLALALAEQVDADLVLANDPDADRLAVAVPKEGEWCLLTGDDIGVLLGADRIESTSGPRSVATTIVSSTLLPTLAAARGVGCHRTLTGFKWLSRADASSPDVPLVFAYEEAIGYGVAPHLVRDKDGISAAVVMADLASRLAAVASTVTERLAEIHREFGRFRNTQVARRYGGDQPMVTMTALMARLREQPPASIGRFNVVGVEDFLPGSALPSSDVLVFELVGGRVAIRPSGTEPKIKAYLEVVGDDPAVLDDLRAGVVRLIE